MNELVRRDSIEELCAHRDRAIELYHKAFETLKEARQAHARATPNVSYIANLPERYDLERGDVAGTLASMTKAVDRDIWKGLITGTRLGSLMDREEREKFRVSVEADPPPATADTVFATLETLLAEAPLIFVRGLVNAFARFCRDYKSNDGFKIGERIVVDRGVTYCPILGFSTNHYTEPEMRDLDRVMHVLDGQPAPKHGEGLCGALYQAIRATKVGGEVRTAYWRARFFKKGTVHLYVLRDDLRAKANKMIAQHFGETLAAGPDVAPRRTDPTSTAGTYKAEDEDYFPTPPALAADLVRCADIQPGHNVLEPSCGTGNIVDAIENAGGLVAAIESNVTRAYECKERCTLAHGMRIRDFLSVLQQAFFDRVVMNPPFSKGQGIRHVLHAMRFLRPGGRLVAVLGAGALAANRVPPLRSEIERLTAQLRDAIDEHGFVEDLPEKSFSGTSVRTIVITYDKEYRWRMK
jgi:hypothetical protein